MQILPCRFFIICETGEHEGHVFLCLMPGVCSCCSLSLLFNKLLSSWTNHAPLMHKCLHRCDLEELCMHEVQSDTENEMIKVKPDRCIEWFLTHLIRFAHFQALNFITALSTFQYVELVVNIFYLITQQFFCLGPVGRAEDHITRSWANNSWTFLLSAARHTLDCVIRQQCLLISIFPRGEKNGWSNAALISRSASIKAAERLTGGLLLHKRLFSLF